MKQHEVPWHNYAVSFSDGRAKTGITSKPFYRLQDYIQEANRHATRVDGFKITPPARSKAIALSVERSVCGRYAHIAVPGHREWFYDDGKWMSRKLRRVMPPKHVWEDIAWAVEYYWGPANVGLWARERLWKFGLELAEALGKSGDRISAVRATAMVPQAVAEVSSDRQTGELSHG